MKLNIQQKKAVESESKQILLVAGAGSGKTRVLIERIAHLIENKNVSPYEICSFTFTRLAAKEMIERLEKRIGPGATNIIMGTQHSISLDFIQRFGDLIGLRPGKITVYNQWQSNYLLKDIAIELGYHSGYAWTGVQKKSLDKCMMMISEFEIMAAHERLEFEKELEIISAFQERCKENNALTYDSILSTFLKLLPEIEEYVNFKHVFVDECQDNSPIQWDITNEICRLSDASLFAVGDINQSIYQFRGADPDYLIRNKHKFDILKLQKNYRSDANIVNAANNLIQNNQSQIDLEMVPVKDAILEVEYVPGVDSNVLCKTIPLIAKNKTAILSRNHFLLEKLSSLLDKAGIFHEYLGKKSKLAHSEEFIRFHAFLNLIVNQFDNFSFLLIKDIIGLLPDDYGEIRILAAEEGESHFNTWADRVFDMQDEFLKLFIIAKTSSFEDTIDRMKEMKFPFPTEDIFEFVECWIIDHDDKSIDYYLNWISTYDIQDEIDKDMDAKIQLMTVHAAKGLEWPIVIIAGLNEGMFPDKRSMDDGIHDERNLAYVAMTRAEQQLILTSRPFKEDLFEIKNPISRFIDEALIK